MLKVGLTGGLACGKSFVGRELARLGAHLIQADELGREVMLPGGEAYAPIVDRFGSEILNSDGAIDRQHLAALVFRQPELLEELSAIVHPAVRARQNAQIQAIARTEPRAIVVVEAAILIETGLYREFDVIVLVTCDPAAQRERALERAGSTLEDVENRVARQLPVEEKMKFAQEIVDTSGTKEATLRRTQEIYSRLLAKAGGQDTGIRLQE